MEITCRIVNCTALDISKEVGVMYSFLSLFEQEAQADKSQVVIKDTDNEVTRSELWEKIKIYRRIAASKGISKGMMVCLKMESNLDWVQSFLTLISIGARVLPISPNTPATEVAEIEKIIQPDFYFNKEEWTSFIVGTPPKDFEPLWAEADDEVLLQPTSGSTGLPRYCVRTLGSLISEGISYKNTLAISQKDVILSVLPIYHSYALGMVIMGGMMSGCSLIFIPKFSPRDFISRLQREKVTVAPIVPIIARCLAKLYTPEQVELTHLRTLLVGAGKIPKDIFKAFYDKYGIWLSSNYGSTETGAVCTRLEQEHYPSVGRPMFGIEVEIRDSNGYVLPTNTEGYIWVKTPGKLKRYWGEEQEFLEEAFLSMGDLGCLNENGTIQISGRSKSIINVGGKKVNPNRVEEILLRHPKVKDAAVIGITKSTGEEMVKAIVVVENDLALAELRAYTHQNLANYEEPTIISYARALPRNEIGKLKMDELILI